MNNTVLIGAVLVVALGGIWYFSNTNEIDTPTTTPTNNYEETADTITDSNNEMETADPTPAMETEATQPTIVEAAIATPVLSTLTTAVTEAELVATLESEGPFTVFAPTNAAFEALPAGTLDTLLLPANQADLQSILTYHVVPGEVMAADLTDGMTVETVNGDTLTFGVTDAGVTVNGAAVTTADVEASNGVVHIIDAVLLPESE